MRVLPPTPYVGAVEAMDEISAMVQQRLEAGAAYPVDDDVYFPVAAAEHFGSVSGFDRETMRALSAERGGDPQRPGKKDPLDVLLRAPSGRANLPGTSRSAAADLAGTCSASRSG